MASAVIASLALSNAALAGGRKLNGGQIAETLEGRTVSGVQNGQAWEQDFHKGGMTDYRAAGEGPSEGRWRVKSDRFCSQWPPARAWVCYDIFRDDDVVSFVPTDGGDMWRAQILPR